VGTDAQSVATQNCHDRIAIAPANLHHNTQFFVEQRLISQVEALNRYDPYRGIRFSSYAQYWIRAMILRFLMDNYRIVRLGSTRHGRKLFFQLQKENASCKST
jgi:RNA polymerase sigma-32 factor